MEITAGMQKPNQQLLNYVVSIITREPMFMFLIVAFSVALRVAYILLMPWLGYDESAYLFIAKQILRGENAYYDFPLFTSPFYVYALSAFLYLFGFGEFQARLFSTVMGSITTVLLYLIGKKLGGTRLGIIVSLLYSTSSFIIHMDSVNEIESLLGVFIVSSVLVLLKYKETDSKALLILLGALSAVAFYTKTSSLFIVLSFPLLILFWKGRKEFILTLVTQIVVALLLFAPFLVGAFRLTVFNVFGYSLVRSQKSMGALESLQYIMWVHGDAGFVMLGLTSLLFIVIKTVFVFMKEKNTNFFTMMQRKEAAVIIPPVSYLVSFLLVNFWWPYLLYPPFIFLQFAIGYLIHIALTKIAILDEIELLRKLPFKLTGARLTSALKIFLMLILVGSIAGSFNIATNSVVYYVNNWQYNRETLNNFVEYIHISTSKDDIIFSTSPSVAFLLDRNLALLQSPYTGLDLINNLRFKAYYEYNLEKPLPEAVFLRENLNRIEAKSFDANLFPLLAKAKYIFIDDNFVLNVPNYEAIGYWLFQNCAFIENPDRGTSPLYRVLGKNTRTALWKGTNANWTAILENNPIILKRESLLDFIVPSSNTQLFQCEIQSDSIPIKKNIYLQIQHSMANNLDDVNFSFMIEMANMSLSWKNWHVPYNAATGRPFAQFFELYNLFEPFSHDDNPRLKAIYIEIKKPTSGILGVEFPVLTVFELNEVE